MSQGHRDHFSINIHDIIIIGGIIFGKKITESSIAAATCGQVSGASLASLICLKAVAQGSTNMIRRKAQKMTAVSHMRVTWWVGASHTQQILLPQGCKQPGQGKTTVFHEEVTLLECHWDNHHQDDQCQDQQGDNHPEEADDKVQQHWQRQ